MINTSIIDKLAPDFIAVGGTLIVFFVPYLSGFITASFSELRLWIALRKAIPAPTLDEASSGGSRESRGRKWHIILAMVALVVLCILGFNLIIKSPSTKSIQNITLTTLQSILYCGLFFMTTKFISNMLGVTKMAVHRTPDGGYLERVHRCRSKKEYAWICLLVVFASLLFLVLVGLWTTGNIISVSIVTVALVHSVSSSSFGKLTLLRMVKRYILILIAIVTLTLLQRLIYQKQVNNNAPETSSVWLHVRFVPTALCSAFSGGLIARMLRFDYQRHLNDPNGSQEIILAIAPVSTAANNIFYKNEDLVEGILIPQWAPRAFLKPYFIVALVTWSIFQITIIVLNLGIGPPVLNPYAAFAMALLLEFPVIVIVLSLFAAFKKEAKALWNYDEGWKLSLTEGAISL